MKRAFTLAEVLITLAIIGIIAAITIPSIIANHQKRTLETQFAKVYRTINQVVQLAIAEHGDISTWDWKNAEASMSALEMDDFVKKYLIPYLNVVKFCPTDKSVRGCFVDRDVKRPDGSLWSNPNTTSRPQVVLADGTAIQFYLRNNCLGKKGWCLSFDIDINGVKNPNALGKDFFYFAVYPQTNEFLPQGINKDASYNEEAGSFLKLSRAEMIENCTVGAGDACGALIIQDGFKINY